MGRWVGTMKTAYLNDRQIRPTEYRSWSDAVRRFERREEDRKTVDGWKEHIERHGLRKPIKLGISARYPEDVYVGNGHHRAVALMELGVREFPFYWYWISYSSVRMETGPFPHKQTGL